MFLISVALSPTLSRCLFFKDSTRGSVLSLSPKPIWTQRTSNVSLPLWCSAQRDRRLKKQIFKVYLDGGLTIIIHVAGRAGSARVVSKIPFPNFSAYPFAQISVSVIQIPFSNEKKRRQALKRGLALKDPPPPPSPPHPLGYTPIFL